MEYNIIYTRQNQFEQSTLTNRQNTTLAGGSKEFNLVNDCKLISYIDCSECENTGSQEDSTSEVETQREEVREERRLPRLAPKRWLLYRCHFLLMAART